MRRSLLCATLSPVPREGYNVGVPAGGYWREILNSDAREYGGSGMGNLGGVEAVKGPVHGATLFVNANAAAAGGRVLQAELGLPSVRCLSQRDNPATVRPRNHTKRRGHGLTEARVLDMFIPGDIMRRAFALILLLLSSSLSSVAQGTVGAPATREDILNLFQVMNLTEQMRQVMDSIAKQQREMIHESIKRRSPQITERELAKFDQLTSDIMKELPLKACLRT